MEDHQHTTMRQARSRHIRFSVLSIDADEAEVQDYIQRLTESDEAYAQRQVKDQSGDVVVETAPVNPSP